MKKELMFGLVWAGVLVALALGASLARRVGYVDGETANRLVTGMNGLMVAWFGNRIPKAVAPKSCVRRAARVGGWAMVLSGLAYAALWAFAPIPFATSAGSVAVAAGTAVTVGYCIWLRTTRWTA